MAIRVDSVEDMIPLADFIADVAGESVEVVLHDIRDAETSIRYIRNGCLSGRQIGDGTTDAALKLIQDGRAESRDYVANYSGKSLENHEFRCATYFIKNPEDQLIGLLCVNVLVDGLGRSSSFWNRISPGADMIARSRRLTTAFPRRICWGTPQRPSVSSLATCCGGTR